ncbi:hypothetical protein Q3C01_22325 [Bradyrhizobium sp. UFLA05-109]
MVDRMRATAVAAVDLSPDEHETSRRVSEDTEAPSVSQVPSKNIGIRQNPVCKQRDASRKGFNLTRS